MLVLDAKRPPAFDLILAATPTQSMFFIKKAIDHLASDL